MLRDAAKGILSKDVAHLFKRYGEQVQLLQMLAEMAHLFVEEKHRALFSDQAGNAHLALRFFILKHIDQIICSLEGHSKVVGSLFQFVQLVYISPAKYPAKYEGYLK